MEIDEIALSSYTFPQLQHMAQQGSLFIAHVVAEGVPLYDPEGLLPELGRFYRPASYEYFRNEIRWAARLLTDSQGLFASRPIAYRRLIIHLSRTLVYATARSLGIETFSMNAIWALLPPEWGPPLPRPDMLTWERYLELKGWLQDRLGLDIANEFVTIEALIVHALGNSRLAVALGLRLLHDHDPLPPYEDTDLWGSLW